MVAFAPLFVIVSFPSPADIETDAPLFVIESLSEAPSIATNDALLMMTSLLSPALIVEPAPLFSM